MNMKIFGVLGAWGIFWVLLRGGFGLRAVGGLWEGLGEFGC